MSLKKSIPRGIRNNNPLNIRVSLSQWIGGIYDKKKDPQFEEFTSMKYGIRAAVRILHTYYKGYKCTNVHDIISRWAPASENNTQGYINFVANKLNVEANQTIAFDKNTIAKLVAAMAEVECGQAIPPEAIEAGIRLAGYPELA